MTEEDIINRALRNKPVNHGTKQLKYYSDEQFIHDLKVLYPAATHVLIVNLNKRFENGEPSITVKKLRQIGCTITTSNSIFGKSTTVNASWNDLIAVLEDDKITVKVYANSIGDNSY